MANAMIWAASSDAAPVTSISTNFVAPSPSRTIWWARSSSTLSRACWKSPNRSSPMLEISSSICSPVANKRTVSLVEVSLSTVMRLNDRATAADSAVWSTSGATARSVKTNPSIVAMSGAIMPLPLAMPTMWAAVPSTRADDALENVSVVRIAPAASVHPSADETSSFAARAGRPERNAASGSVSPITPVDARYTRCGSTPRASPTSSAVSAAAVSPALPVNALALPLLHTTALAVRSPAARIVRHQSTGALGHRLLVNVAATVVPSASSARKRSARLA